MTRQENERIVRNFFEEGKPKYVQLASSLVDDAEAAVEEAARIFERMIPNMAYVEKPEHPMASITFVTMTLLAVHLALRERGVGVHDFGSAMLTAMAQGQLSAPEETVDDRPPLERFAAFVASAEASQRDAAPGEYVFEAILGDRKDFDWAMNVKSCGACHAFSKYDARDLVPYFCAADDVISDQGHQGLRRTGTIALGAHQCDFRYKRGGEPRRLATQYPDRIRVAED